MPREARGRVGVLAAVLACLLLLAPGASAFQLRGFNDTTLGRGQIPRSTFLNWLDDSGARIHRIEPSWQTYEPHQGQYTPWFWGKHDPDYKDELARDVNQLIVLEGTPYWALTPEGKTSTAPGGVWRCDSGSTPCNAPPNVRDPAIRDKWKQWVRTITERYPNAAGIQIWNEPNLRWNWFQAQDPDLYSLMLKYAYEAVRSVNPWMPVVSGSMATYQGPSDADKTDYTAFLDTVYRVAGAGSFSGLGLNSYSCKNQGTWHAVPQRQLGIVRSIKSAHGDAAKRVWLTETGANTGPADSATCGTRFTEGEQKDAEADLLDWAKREQDQTGDLPVVLIQSLFDGQEETLARKGGYGLLGWTKNPLNGNIGVRPKPSYSVVRCRMRGTC